VSARPRKCYEAAVDSRRCIQFEPYFPAEAGCGDATGTPQPPTGSRFCHFVFPNLMGTDCNRHCRHSWSFPAPSRRNQSFVASKLPPPIFEGFHHGLLGGGPLYQCLSSSPICTGTTNVSAPSLISPARL